MSDALAAAAPPPPIGAHPLLLFLLQAGVLLLLAVALGRLAQRLGMPAVVGELTAGVLLGPSLFAWAAPAASGWLFPGDAGQRHMLDAVGLLGVLLLVGVTGMHIDLGLVRRKGVAAAWVSGGGLIVPVAAGIGLGLLLPASLMTGDADRPVFALFVGVALGVSAIPVIAKTLIEMKLLHRDIGQLIVSAAAVDDVLGWLLLSIVTALATTGLVAGELALSVVALVAVVAATRLLGRRVVDTSLRLASRSTESGPAIATVVVLVLLAAAGTHALGMEPLLGALLCGLLIGSSDHLDRARLAPLRTVVMAVLAPLYFATAGLRMDLTALREPAVLGAAVLLLAVAVATKFAGAYAGARIGRLGHWEALALGAGLNARGVIQVIVATVGLRLGVLSTAGYTIVVLVAIVTSLMAPPLLRAAVRRIPVTEEEHERGRVLEGRQTR